ncbi:MAG: copper chaperone PCu(A)C [Nevskia sp.]
MTRTRSISSPRPLIAGCALALLAALAACKPASLPAGEFRAGALRVTAATSRETPIPGAVAVGYLQIENTGREDDVLLGATAAIASGVELHEMKTVDGQMQMRALADGLPLPAGRRVALQSGGAHLMLLGVARPLLVGEKIPLTLHFAKAGDAAIELQVQPLLPAAN